MPASMKIMTLLDKDVGDEELQEIMREELATFLYAGNHLWLLLCRNTCSPVKKQANTTLA